MRNRMAMLAVVVLIVGGLGAWMVRNLQARAPADVRHAAELLKTSRVGYAMVKPDRTYLIIATGEQGPKVKIDRVEAQPAGGDAKLVEVFLKTAQDGQQLLISTMANTAQANYQFNLDGVSGGIPTLVNHHNLPLVHLDQAHGFAVITPVKEQLVTGAKLHVSGFARVFEGAFMVRVVTADGREVGAAAVKAKEGAPAWGCFNADVTIATTNVTETGFVVFEGEAAAKLTLPVRFKPPGQVGLAAPAGR